jgi:flagellar biosynthetic protein FliP
MLLAVVALGRPAAAEPDTTGSTETTTTTEAAVIVPDVAPEAPATTTTTEPSPAPAPSTTIPAPVATTTTTTAPAVLAATTTTTTTARATATTTAPSGTRTAAAPAAPVAPAAPAEPAAVIQGAPAGQLSLNLAPAPGTSPTSQPLTILLLLTVVSLGPAMMILLTSFTRIVIVLGLTRNALNLNGVPPNQVLIGLGLFLTLFVMGPVFSKANTEAVQPFLKGQISQSEAMNKGIAPFREFMFKQTRESDLALFSKLSGSPPPANKEDVSTTTLIPAFVIGELRAAFLIGFVIFIPFLVIDILASTALMSMGMVMLPPVLISLPFKLLLFVVVDGWYLVVQSLVKSFH